MSEIEESIHIDSTAGRIFDLLAEPELLGEHMDSVHSVKVLSRGVNSLLFETAAGTDGRDTVFILDVRLFPPKRIEFHQVKGELRSLVGRDLIEPEDGGSRVTEHIDFDIGVPIFGGLIAKLGIRQIIEQQTRQRLAVLKKIAEDGAGGATRQ